MPVEMDQNVCQAPHKSMSSAYANFYPAWHMGLAIA